MTKECENKDCCVGEKEINRKEKMVMGSNSSVVAANILMKVFVLAFWFWAVFVCLSVQMLVFA